jgi:hypothetical protein
MVARALCQAENHQLQFVGRRVFSIIGLIGLDAGISHPNMSHENPRLWQSYLRVLPACRWS